MKVEGLVESTGEGLEFSVETLTPAEVLARRRGLKRSLPIAEHTRFNYVLPSTQE